ncbi:MAG: DUF4360 domain-containing protein [Polyangiales bacterium]
MFACAAGLALLSLAACGAEEGDDAATVSAQVGSALDAGTAPSSDAAVAPSVDAGPPAYTATVSAAGTGCPAGSYEARIGQSGDVSLSFDDYEATVGADAAEVTKDCQVTVKLSAKSGASYAVSKYAHHGRATLEKGVDGKQTSSFYFPNARGAGRLRNSFLAGPLDAPVHAEPLRTSDVMWTPCALENQLIVTTRLVLKNGTSGAKGTVSVGSGDDVNAGIDIGLSVRPCTIPPPPAPR